MVYMSRSKSQGSGMFGDLQEVFRPERAERQKYSECSAVEQQGIFPLKKKLACFKRVLKEKVHVPSVNPFD